MARTHSKNAPHQSIIVVTSEVMERLKDGRMSGIPVDKSNDLFTIYGKNFEDCQEKTNQAIQKIKDTFNNE